MSPEAILIGGVVIYVVLMVLLGRWLFPKKHDRGDAMRTLIIDKNGEVTLGDHLPEPMPTNFVRVGGFSPRAVKDGAGFFDVTPVPVDRFVRRGYIAMKDGRNVLAIYEQES